MFIEVSSGTSVSGDLSPVRQKIVTVNQQAYNANLARRIKSAISIPVMVAGGCAPEMFLTSGSGNPPLIFLR